jgi:hypothetical protein
MQVPDTGARRRWADSSFDSSCGCEGLRLTHTESGRLPRSQVAARASTLFASRGSLRIRLQGDAQHGPKASLSPMGNGSRWNWSQARQSVVADLPHAPRSRFSPRAGSRSIPGSAPI